MLVNLVLNLTNSGDLCQMPNEYERHKNAEPLERTKKVIRRIIYYTSQGKSERWIAEKIGYSPISISYLKQKKWYWSEIERMNGKLPNPIVKRNDRYTETEIEKLKALNAKGWNNHKIANELNRSNASVRRHLKRLGLKSYSTPRKAMLYTDAEIREMIRLRVDEKLSYKEIGERLGRNFDSLRIVLIKHIGKTPSPRTHEKIRKEWEKINPDIAESISTTLEYQPMFDAADD